MGAGKSAVGRHLAGMLGYTFVDSDQWLEERTGVDIPYIFEVEGEEGFRRREADAIDRLTRTDETVLATGGGVVKCQENRATLAERGFVIYLRASVEQQYARVRASQNRPMLAGKDVREVLQTLFAERAPHYEAIADLIVETDGSKVPVVAARVAATLQDRDYGEEE